jgi:para-aminobenzoate synthetase/4-amino-4-deoxychorismate lyase
VIDGLTGAAVFGSGGAIVWDSEPAEEYREAAAKAAILTARTNEFDLLETMAFTPGVGLRNRDRHLERLARSAEYFGFQFCRRTIGDQLDQAVAAPEAPVKVRLTLTQSGQTSIETGPMGGPSAGPVRLALDDDPVDPSDVRLFHKTTDRAIYNERRHRHPNADDVVLVNTRGEVTEATIANVAVCVSGQWCTPPVAAGCLPGVARAGFVEDGTLIERTITVAQLRAATAVALVSSARGWRPAVMIDP